MKDASLYAWMSLAITAIIGVITLLIQRRKDAETAKSSDFGVSADIGMQIANKVIASNEGERKRYDDILLQHKEEQEIRFASLRAAYDQEIGLIKEHIERCEIELAETERDRTLLMRMAAEHGYSIEMFTDEDEGPRPTG